MIELTTAEIRVIHDHADKQRCRFGFVASYDAHWQRGLLLDRLEKLEPKTCLWKLDDTDAGIWETECRAAWIFECGGVEDNGINYCQCCGGKVIQETTP